MTTSDRPINRRDLHNTSTHFGAALAGRCAFTHLDSGRVCLLAFGHSDDCWFVLPHGLLSFR